MSCFWDSLFSSLIDNDYKFLYLKIYDIKNNLSKVDRGALVNILEDIKKNNSLQTITVETFNKRAESFYKNKLNFHYIGKKLRFFKNLIVYKKKLL